jgi:hypothetical protein
MKLSGVFFQRIPGHGIMIFGIPVGQIKHLLDRYRNYLGWFQLPLILYTAIISTLQYLPPEFSGHLTEMFIFSVVGFIIFTVVAVFIDLKFIFPSEREFMYNRTPYFERRFEALDKKLDGYFNGQGVKK